MISSWIRKKEIEEARQDERALMMEAFNTRKKDGETIQQAIERVEAERASRR